MDAQNRLELSIIENAQREDLNAIELATAYAKLQTQFNLTPEDIAAKVGKSEQAINNTLRLLTLPDEVKKTMVKEILSQLCSFSKIQFMLSPILWIVMIYPEK